MTDFGSELWNKFSSKVITRETLIHMLYYIKDYDRSHNINRNILIIANGYNISINESSNDCIIINDKIEYESTKKNV